MPRQASTTKRVRVRNWCFTLNNYTPEEIAEIDKFFTAKPDHYCVYGKEVGDSGTPHLQGYIHLPGAFGASHIKKIVPRAHVEACKGNTAQNIAYCSKGGDVTTYGIPPKTQKQAQQDVQTRFATLARAGEFDTILNEMPGLYNRMYRTMKEMSVDHLIKPANLVGPCGLWIYGPSGIGKTHYAETLYPKFYPKGHNKWWDGYSPTDHDTAIFHDLSPDHDYLVNLFKLWMDERPFLAEMKGGTKYIRPGRFIVTSQFSIEEVFGRKGPHALDAINRRCEVYHMTVRPNLDELEDTSEESISLSPPQLPASPPLTLSE